jgi:integrase
MGGNNKGRRRRFGAVRKLPSGNFQVRYPGPDGTLRPDDHTYPTRSEAEQRLVEIEADMMRGAWVDPDAGKVSLKSYATNWIAERDLSERSAENYGSYLRNHIGPYIGHVMLVDLKSPGIRTWRKQLQDSGVGAPTVAKVYRFLHSVLATAEDDELIRRNPCRISGAGQEKSPERPTASLPEVFAIAAAIQPRYRLLVLLAAFGQLRFGELLGLRRGDLTLPPRRKPTQAEVAAGADPAFRIDDGMPLLRVDRAISQLNNGQQRVKGPKSDAGQRSVALPAAILPEIRAHLALEGFSEQGVDGRLFVGPKKATPRRQNFNRIWKKALAVAGVNAKLHLHDLRHTGGTLTAQSGATLKEIMARLGHSSTRAAMIYQHATDERDRQIAGALNAMIEAARTEAERSADPGDQDAGDAA